MITGLNHELSDHYSNNTRQRFCSNMRYTPTSVINFPPPPPNQIYSRHRTQMQYNSNYSLHRTYLPHVSPCQGVFISPTPYPISSSILPVSRKRIHSNPSDLRKRKIDEETFDAATALLSLVSKKEDMSKDAQDISIEDMSKDAQDISIQNGNINSTTVKMGKVFSTTSLSLCSPLTQELTSISSSGSSSGKTNKEYLVSPNKIKQEMIVSDVPKTVTSKSEWYTGSISLALKDDEEVLSPLHTFMRKYCIEAFASSHGSMKLGLVGIRCVHCKNTPIYNRAERAVCYPSSIKNIYYSMETWQRRHAAICQDIPIWVKRQIILLIQSSRSTAGGRRQYWSDAAIKLGMIDTPEGIRFSRIPGVFEDQFDHYKTSNKRPLSNNGLSKIKLVEPIDKLLITEYLYLLMDQMESCQFTEQDRSGGRSKIKDNQVGYPGMQCKHCSGKAGFGRYFPSSLYSLTLANSDRNIYNHMMKCRRCPQTIKYNLQKLNVCHSEDGSKNKRGSRKFFFSRVWKKIHT